MHQHSGYSRPLRSHLAFFRLVAFITDSYQQESKFMQKSDSTLTGLSKLIHQDTQSEDAWLTLFAPTDAAFEDVSEAIQALDTATFSDVRLSTRLSCSKTKPALEQQFKRSHMHAVHY
jgi:hypothetical protein